MQNKTEAVQKWKLAAENVLSVLLSEEVAYDNFRAYERSLYEMGLRSAHFPSGQHRIAFKALIKLRDERKPVHPGTIAASTEGLSEDWVYRLVATYDASIDGAVFEENVRILIGFGEEDRIVTLLAQAQNAIRSGQDHNSVTMKLMTILASSSSANEINGETADAGAVSFEAMLGESPNKTLKLGIPPIDGWMGGLGEAEVLGVVGMYKGRKSSTARSAVKHLVDEGGSVDLCMLESNATMVRALFICMYAIEWLRANGEYEALDDDNQPIRDISAKELVRARNKYLQWHKTQVAAIQYGIRRFKALGNRLRIFDKTAEGGALKDLDSIKRVLLRSKQRYGKADLAVVDHMLLISGFETEHELMKTASIELETFARHERMNLMLLAQMSEEAIKAGSRRRTSGVKGGGDLAAACDYVFTVNYKGALTSPKRGAIAPSTTQDNILRITMEYSRYGEGGKNVYADVEIDPATGLIFGFYNRSVQNRIGANNHHA